MKILHTADLHHHSDPLYSKDIQSVVSQMCHVAKEEQVDLIVVAGDLFHTAVEIGSLGAQSAIETVASFSDVAPLVLLRGTSTHDVGRCLDVFKKMKNPIQVIQSPTIFTYHGAIAEKRTPCDFYCLPGMRRKMFDSFMAKINQDITKLPLSRIITLLFDYWNVERENRQQMDRSRETILLGHFQLDDMAMPQMETGYEPIISSQEILSLLNPSIALLGHVHTVYDKGPFVYSGNPLPLGLHYDDIVLDLNTQTVLSDKSKKGFFVHEALGKRKWKHNFHQLNQRKNITLFLEGDIIPQKILDFLTPYINQGETNLLSVQIKGVNKREQAVESFKEVQSLKSVFEENGITLSEIKIVAPDFKQQRRDFLSSEEEVQTWEQKSLEQKIITWSKNNGFDIDEETENGIMEKMTILNM